MAVSFHLHKSFLRDNFSGRTISKKCHKGLHISRGQEGQFGVEQSVAISDGLVGIDSTALFHIKHLTGYPLYY